MGTNVLLDAIKAARCELSPAYKKKTLHRICMRGVARSSNAARVLTVYMTL